MSPPIVGNPGRALRPEWFEHAQVKILAARRRAESLMARRAVKQQWQAAWLVKAISCIDLITLAGDDTVQRVARLCAKARAPLRGSGISVA